MPAYRFSWDQFDDLTVRALARGEGWSEADGEARLWLQGRVKRPNDGFVRRHKATLASVWLPQYAGAQLIVDCLQDAWIGPMGPRPETAADAARYVDRCRNTSRLRQAILDALLRFGDAERAPEAEADVDFLPRFVTLKRASQALDSRKAHPYQNAAWAALSAHAAQAETTDTFAGLLVMPTGSGKTYTAVRWLMENVVARGGRVLWLAHRSELLNQAAREFHRLAGHAGNRDAVRVRIVSGQHCATTMIDPADDVVVASIASVARRLDIVEQVLRDGRSFVVIDEAHHAPAKSYRSVLDRLSGGPRRLLGLTATPTRTAEGERPLLARMFSAGVLFEQKITDLILQGYLARPIPVRVPTGAAVEQGLTEDDLATMTKFSQLSDEWLERIGGMVTRNKIIVGHYANAKNREKYGKTLVFAVNVEHAAMLTEMFRAQGIAAEYIASYRVSDDGKTTRGLLEQFRAKDGGIEVLVNVQIATEGVDLPAVKTVFLTRPTTSEILIRQMIGRALRGPAAQGTETAYVVAFQDHWERFRDWQDPLALVPDVIPPGSEGEPNGEELPVVARGADAQPVAEGGGLSEAMQHLPWDVVVELAREIRLLGPGHEADVFEAVHHGWYVLEREDDGEEVRQTIAAYEHDRPAWEACFGALYQMNSARLAAADTAMLFAEFFADCDEPAPSADRIREALEHVRAGGERPVFRELAERKLCDPYQLAQVIHEQDLGERRRQELLKERYSPLAKAIFPTQRTFQQAVNDALFELQNPEEATRVPRAIPIFEPRADQMLRPGPAHDLDQLMREVLKTGSELLGHQLPHHGPVQWTKRIIKGWYGMANWEAGVPFGHGRIRLNVLLDSPDIEAGTIRLLLWHEYLHLYLQQGHPPQFRELERKWPGIQAADRQLDTLNERFGVQYW